VPPIRAMVGQEGAHGLGAVLQVGSQDGEGVVVARLQQAADIRRQRALQRQWAGC